MKYNILLHIFIFQLCVLIEYLGSVLKDLCWGGQNPNKMFGFGISKAEQSMLDVTFVIQHYFEQFIII